MKVEDIEQEVTQNFMTTLIPGESISMKPPVDHQVEKPLDVTFESGEI